MGFAVFVFPESSSSVGQQQQRGEQEYGGKMTKNEIIEKTLKEMGTPPLENEPPYSEEREHEEIVLAELQRRLPDAETKTCDDFKHLNTACCETCHTSYPHYDMNLIDLPDGAKAWVCDAVEWAIYPERREELRLWWRNSAEGKRLSQILGFDDPDDPSSELR
jgi:hypothetical protein